MNPLANYLRDELARRDWSIDEFAKRAGLSQSNAYLIVRDGKDNVRRETFAGIAAALSMTPAQLYAAIEPSAPNPVEQAIRQRTAEMAEVVEGVPQPFRATIIAKIFDRALDGARDMAALLVDQPRTAVTGEGTPRVTEPKTVGNRAKQADDQDLRFCLSGEQGQKPRRGARLLADARAIVTPRSLATSVPRL